MPNLQLTWTQGAGLTVLLLVLDVIAVRRRARLEPYLREATILAALYSVWQLAGTVSLSNGQGAVSHGYDLDRLERWLRWPHEASVQRLILGHTWAQQACNLYYATMHFTALGVFLVWLFVRHRSDYVSARRVLAATTLICLVIQLVPVAPPRLLPRMGMIDVAAVQGQSVYGVRGLTLDQIAAMPSVHVAWASLIAWAVIRYGRSRWRWLVLLHLLATVFVVVATANHFWLDGVAAMAILAICIVVVDRLPGGRNWIGRSREADRAARATVGSVGTSHSPV